MPIVFVDRQLNDNSRVVDPLLAEAAPSSCRSTVKGGSSPWHFFILFLIMANMMKNVVNAFNQSSSDDEQ